MALFLSKRYGAFCCDHRDADLLLPKWALNVAIFGNSEQECYKDWQPWRNMLEPKRNPKRRPK
jgi:hypothetical protein